MSARREARPLRDKAYLSFTRHLLSFSIRPGQFLSQRQLVETTGLPLGAIRELIPRLEAEGLIRTVPQRGLQVLSVDDTLVRNAFQLRLFLEKEAIALFVDTVTDAGLAVLRAGHEAVMARSAGGITAALLDEAQRVDWSLHDALIAALCNELIEQTYRVNAIKLRLIRWQQTSLTPEGLMPAMGEHLRIISALERRNRADAVGSLVDHIESAAKRALEG